MWESEALKGQVKDAINQKINHQEIPILDDLYDVLYETGQSFTKLIRTLQDSLSEHAGNAVINSQYLDQLIKQLHSFDDDVQQEVKSINAKMAEASSAGVQLKSLSADQCLKMTNEAQKLLTDTNQTLAQFNQRNDQSLSQHLAQISKQLKGIEGVSSLSYTDPQSLAFYSDTHYRDHVKSVHQATAREVLEKQDPDIARLGKGLTQDDLIYIQQLMANSKYVHINIYHLDQIKEMMETVDKSCRWIVLSPILTKGQYKHFLSSDMQKRLDQIVQTPSNIKAILADSSLSLKEKFKKIKSLKNVKSMDYLNAFKEMVEDGEKKLPHRIKNLEQRENHCQKIIDKNKRKQAGKKPAKTARFQYRIDKADAEKEKVSGKIYHYQKENAAIHRCQQLRNSKIVQNCKKVAGSKAVKKLMKPIRVAGVLSSAGSVINDFNAERREGDSVLKAATDVAVSKGAGIIAGRAAQAAVSTIPFVGPALGVVAGAYVDDKVEDYVKEKL